VNVTVWLGICDGNRVGHVNADVVGERRQFVRQRDVDIAVQPLEHFHTLGGGTVCRTHHARVRELLVQRRGQAAALGVDAADNLRIGTADVSERAPAHRPLGTEREPELGHIEPALAFERRLDAIAARPRGNCRFDDHEIAGCQAAGDRLHDGIDRPEVRLAVSHERRHDDDVNSRVRGSRRPRRGRCQSIGFHKMGE